MQTLTKRLGAVMLAAVLLVALACGGVMAWAQDDDAAVAGENTLTVNANVEAPGETATINVNVDVYQIATAAKDPQFDTYHYTFIEGFSDLEKSYDEQNMTGAKWQALADEAVKLIDGVTPVAKGEPTGTKISGLSNGLFLVVAADVTGNVYKYSFNPTIVALPTKEPLKDDQGNVVVDEDGYPIINTSADFGEWIPDAEISLKYTYEQLYGNLKVKKKVENFIGEPASFVFHIVGTTPTGEEYDNELMVFYDGVTDDDGFCSAVDTHIPAGTKVRVTEVYESNRFERGAADNAEKTIVAKPEGTEGNDYGTIAVAEFENSQTPQIPGGHGIQNTFTWEKTGDGPNDWNLNWHAVPEDEASDRASESN